MKCSIIFCLLIVCAIPVLAQNSYSHLYIAISDALISAKQDKDEEVDVALAQFESNWSSIKSDEKEEKAKVDEALQEALNASTKEQKITALKQLSNALRALEKKENPVDETAQREEFAAKMAPVTKSFEQALNTGDIKLIEAEYTNFNIKWNKYERPVREQSIAMYGDIETKMAFIRIAIASEEPDVATINGQYEVLKQTIEDFIAGKETAKIVEGDYSLGTLVDYIEESLSLINESKYEDASKQIQQFIMIWPQVEQEISTRNGSLYTKIESDMPLIVSSLMKSSVDEESIISKLTKMKTEIQLLQTDTSYSFWDSALILLREGLEALLIILALCTFLKKSGQDSMQKWIFVGAGIGVLLSVVAAIIMSTILNAATVDSNRELLEGYVGLIAATMMIGVGIWLHNKSSITSWNRYISKQMNNAISKGSVISMASISFLSVFREGAETIVFYVGIVPKMEMSQFLLGILVAIIILVIVAFILVKLTDKIPVYKFFAVATALIYVLAFKIIGGSLHTLQLLGKLSTTVVEGLPVVSTIGFYPTVETIIGQAVLLALIVITIIYKRMKNKV